MNKWRLKPLESTEANLKFNINHNDERLSTKQFLHYLKSSIEFRTFYNNILINCGFAAFFWENKPLTNEKLNNDYECNLVNSQFLADQSPDSETFRNYFDSDKEVVTFKNLGKDADLIVPVPKNEVGCYTHIGAFVRCKNRNQIDAFWKTVANETLRITGNKPVWLSTSGSGVYWLHARIDTYPKYYQTEEYKLL